VLNSGGPDHIPLPIFQLHVELSSHLLFLHAVVCIILPIAGQAHAFGSDANIPQCLVLANTFTSLAATPSSRFLGDSLSLTRFGAELFAG